MMPILAITDAEDARVTYEALHDAWHAEWAKESPDSEKTGRLALLMTAAHAEYNRLSKGTDDD